MHPVIEQLTPKEQSIIFTALVHFAKDVQDSANISKLQKNTVAVAAEKPLQWLANSSNQLIEKLFGDPTQAQIDKELEPLVHFLEENKTVAAG
jgi:hypothetical protein